VAAAFHGLRWVVRTTVALTIAGLIIAVLIKLLTAKPEETKTAASAVPATASTTAVAAPSSQMVAGLNVHSTQPVKPSAPVPAPETTAVAMAPPPPPPPIPPAPVTTLGQGTIFPLGAVAWVAPPASTDDASLGVFQNDTRVEILDRVSGPYGWDWLKLKGDTKDGQTVEAFVRADLVAGANIKPQPGVRCARDNGNAEYGRTPVYSRDIIKVMTGLRDSHPDLVIALFQPKTFFTVSRSLRAANGWEWHTVQLPDGRQGVIRADQLRPAPASQQGNDWICQNN
jgi:hypothetical protein